MSTALLNLLFAQIIYKQFVDAEAETRQNAESPSNDPSKKPLPLPASPEFFIKLSQDLKSHPLNSDFNLSPGACQSLYNALFPQNPTRPTTTIIQSLLAKLYESYKKDIVAQINQNELQYKLKLKEIEKIENGNLDTEILAEQEKDSNQVLLRQKALLQKQQDTHKKQQPLKKTQTILQPLKTPDIQSETNLGNSISKDKSPNLEAPTHKDVLSNPDSVNDKSGHPIKISKDFNSADKPIPSPTNDNSKYVDEHTLTTEINNESPKSVSDTESNVAIKDELSEKEDATEKRVTRSAAKAKQQALKEDGDIEIEPDQTSKKINERRESQRIKRQNVEKGNDVTIKDEPMSPRKKELKGIDDDTNSGNGSGIDDDDNDEEDGDDERSDDNEDQNSDENGPTPAPSSRTRSSVRREGDTKTSRKRKRGNSSQLRSSVGASNRRFFTLVNPLISNISSNKSASFFANPVNPNDAPNYYDLIYEPTDLRTIKAKVKDGRIQSTAELERELQLMFANAVMYNGWDSDVSMWTREMQHDAETLLVLFRGAERTAANSNAVDSQHSDSGSQNSSPIASDIDTEDEAENSDIKKQKK